MAVNNEKPKKAFIQFNNIIAKMRFVHMLNFTWVPSRLHHKQSTPIARIPPQWQASSIGENVNSNGRMDGTSEKKDQLIIASVQELFLLYDCIFGLQTFNIYHYFSIYTFTLSYVMYYFILLV